MADQNFSIINLEALSEPASKLIDAVRASIGLAYAPTHVRRMAKAEADAKMILAKGDAAASDFEVRAAERVRNRELRRQKNIEAVTQKALHVLPPTVSKDPVDPDWIAEFFEKCQDVSNEEMHRVWASLLAGEVARPGTFSVRTLGVVKTLRQADAERFNRLCTALWGPRDKPFIILATHAHEHLQRYFQLELRDLIELQSLGLIELNTVVGFDIAIEKSPTGITYFDRRAGIEVGTLPFMLPLGHVVLTNVGSELATVSSPAPNYEYMGFVLERWREKGVTISTQNEGTPAT
jgi:hypothetical protein